MYSLELLQAINDWQCGGDAKQKERRGQRLKELAVQLDLKFRACDAVCYRQIALLNGGVWKLIAENQLTETVSAWTTELHLVKNFKGGVPPKNQGWQGVIFSLQPGVGNVILNLNTLYADPVFLETVETHKSKITRFVKGIGKYGNTQSEVIIELKRLDLAKVHAFGGYSLSVDSQDFANRYLSHMPAKESMYLIDQTLAKYGRQFGPYWIEDKAVANVLERMQPHIEELQHVKQMQDADKKGC